MIKRLFLLSALLLFIFQAQGQIDTVEKKLEHPIPGKAALYSALFPGAGQYYNKKYWKMPIVYIGLGIAIYTLHDNNKNVNYFTEQLSFQLDSDPSTISECDGSFNCTEFLQQSLNQYKKWRDWSYISIGIIYALNIIDANVDAHLAHFDVSEDLTLDVLPYMEITAQTSAGLSLVLKL